MSDNPFDIFAADLKAAVPASEQDNANASGQGQPINIMAAPAPAPVPVMNAPQQPPMGGAPPAPMGMPMQNTGMGGPMGGAPPAPMGMMGGPMGAMNNNPYQMQQPPAPAMGGMPPMGGAPAQANPMNMYGQPPAPAAAPNAMVASTAQSNPYAIPMQAPATPSRPPQPAAPVPASPFGAPVPPSPAVPVPPAPAPMDDPWGAPAPVPMGMAAPAPPVPPSMPSDATPMPPVAPAPAQPMPADPWGAPAPQPAAPGAIVPAPNAMPADDPFGVFNTPAPAPPAPAPVNPNDQLSVATPAYENALSQGQVLAAADGGDPWAEMGFGAPTPAPAPAAGSVTGGGSLLGDDALVPKNDAVHKEGELPTGGEWYDARIFTPTLGVMFFKPQELTDSLFLQTDRSLVEALDDRPVVAFIVEGSSARAAGVELGHVLLKVNGIDVKNPKEASRLIKEGPRPLPLLFYVPDTTVVVAEGEHMVKYDTRETNAPNSAKDWKPKYVVIGGIIAQPWMMNMYRSKVSFLSLIYVIVIYYTTKKNHHSQFEIGVWYSRSMILL